MDADSASITRPWVAVAGVGAAVLFGVDMTGDAVDLDGLRGSYFFPA